MPREENLVYIYIFYCFSPYVLNPKVSLIQNIEINAPAEKTKDKFLILIL